jgi:hypothetical protein
MLNIIRLIYKRSLLSLGIRNEEEEEKKNKKEVSLIFHELTWYTRILWTTLLSIPASY